MDANITEISNPYLLKSILFGDAQEIKKFKY